MVANQSIVIKPIPKQNRIGVLKVESGRILHAHEMITLTKLLLFGDDIICQKESKIIKTADIIWRDEEWEMKHITGKSRNTLTYNLRKAKKQSKNVILDLSDFSTTFERSFGKIKEFLRKNKEIIKILIISKENYCLIHRTMLR